MKIEVKVFSAILTRLCMYCDYTRPKYQVIVYRTIGPLVLQLTFIQKYDMEHVIFDGPNHLGKTIEGAKYCETTTKTLIPYFCLSNILFSLSAHVHILRTLDCLL